MSVLVKSRIAVFAQGLAKLLVEAGLEASTEGSWADFDAAILDLTHDAPPYREAPPIPTIAIAPVDDDAAVQLLRLRYRGIVHAEEDSHQMIRAIRAVRRGEIWADRALLTRALSPRNEATPTPREQETLYLLSKGFSNRTIAERMGIKEGTVKMHVSRLLAKYNVRSRTELLAKILEH